VSFCSLIVRAAGRRAFATLAVLVCAAAASAHAQQPTRPDTVRRDTTPPVPRATVPPPLPTDTVPAAADTTPRAPRRQRPVAASPIPRPPISPRRAMIYSLLVPGLGQARLQRAATGAFFAFVEAGALAMAAKSSFDLAEAKAFRGDSLIVASIPVDTAGVAGTPVNTTQRNPFGTSLARARRLHLEDWLALVAFNHLISGAEAFVSANLWGVPGEVAVRPTPNGAALSMTVAW
jgi:hypothetical protein